MVGSMSQIESADRAKKLQGTSYLKVCLVLCIQHEVGWSGSGEATNTFLNVQCQLACCRCGKAATSSFYCLLITAQRFFFKQKWGTANFCVISPFQMKALETCYSKNQGSLAARVSECLHTSSPVHRQPFLFHTQRPSLLVFAKQQKPALQVE